MDQRAAAALALGHDHLDAEPGQQANRRLVDAGIQHRLRAAGEDRDAAAPLALQRGGLPGRRCRRWPGTEAGASFSIARERLQRRHARPEQSCERPAERRQPQRGAEARRDSGSTKASSARISAVGQRPPVGLLDMGAGVVDQMHVVHARRAGRHAGEAGQAAVDMGDDLPVGRPAVLQHVLDQVDAAARECRVRCRASHRSGRSRCRSRNARICAGSFPIPRHAGRQAGRG